MFMNIIRSSDRSIRGSLFAFLLFVFIGFFWLVSKYIFLDFSVVLLGLRIDNYIQWSWWVVTLPLIILDLFLLVLYVKSIPSIFKRKQEERDLPPEERIPITPQLLSVLNSILLIVAQFCLLLRLDHVWNVTMTVSLIPYYIYSLHFIYMPYVLYREKLISGSEAVDMIMDFVYPVTIFLCCLKYDQLIHVGWGVTFIVIWIVLGLSLLRDLVMTCLARSAGVFE